MYENYGGRYMNIIYNIITLNGLKINNNWKSSHEVIFLVFFYVFPRFYYLLSTRIILVIYYTEIIIL